MGPTPQPRNLACFPLTVAYELNQFELFDRRPGGIRFGGRAVQHRNAVGCSNDMSIVTNILTSSLGKKYTMAVSGFILFLFVIGHLVGNLQVFLGREAINRYGHFLQTNPELIWPARLFLLAMVGLHIWSAARISVENKAARPVGYAVYEPVGSTYASRTMLMSGLIVLAFIIYHLLHFTVQVKAVNLTGIDFQTLNEPPPGLTEIHSLAPPSTVDPNLPPGRHDIFAMMVTGFSNVWVSAFYILGMGLLCLHLSHGASSMFQSIGWKNDAYRPFLDKAGRVLAVLIFLGYVSIPVAILAGYGKGGSH
jgi:succinate dehydrogenase / fumarate reductase, cytochrome b subunit